ncbi:MULTISPECIES: sulfur carrier protein ThiS [Staphylococcus]|uniref:Sulfur carrier protein ThiS n=2 Tax=Staphylococcus TaxID=1279 RepID=A0A9X0PFR4_9STAP|nr:MULTISPECIES: sulfur carrier protein ThiS [Staphylococcus]QGS46901.1 sulfur carrier protein ThiS [Mammaliicoccus fleurettii]EPD53425.1 thiamine biosynthesis protein ThiS [Staphylococcus sp. HGB0015]MBA8759637.1 sulfur carrier protein ThiS [Staphylococcus coagulans]MBA8761005.1 sulfur carrier protein ThiS [Staphylococcus coagulans]MBA8767583.1 sulfur carrier protein ThiS [Staphylococcus coagulans]
MQVYVNGERQLFDEGTTIRDILNHFGIESKRMAVERNEEVVKRSEWDTTEVREDDQLELLEFVGGG